MSVSRWEWLIPAGIALLCALAAVLRRPDVTFRRGFWRSWWAVGLVWAAFWTWRALAAQDEPTARRVLGVLAAVAVVGGAALHWWRYRRARA